MEVFLVYLWLKLDDAISFLNTMPLIGTLALAAATVVLSIYAHDELRSEEVVDNKGRKITKPAWVFLKLRVKLMLTIFAVSLVLSHVLPSSKQTAVLIATHYGVKAIQSDTVQKMVELAKGKANAYLDEQLQELTKTKEKK